MSKPERNTAPRHGILRTTGCLVKLALASLAAVTLLQNNALAHALGEGYLFLKVADDSLESSFEITLVDLNLALPLDTDADGKVSDAEVDAAADDIVDYLMPRIGIGAGGNWYPLEYTEYFIRNLPQGRFLQLHYSVATPPDIPDEIDLRYEVLFDTDTSHRGFLVVTENTKTGVVNKGEDTTLRFEPDRTVHSLNVHEMSRWTTFKTFVGHGIWHIWIGVDHILFLVALILPAVLIRRDGRWHGVQDFGPALWEVIKIVTLFTIAHTITLTMAALGLVSIPSRIVESVIAASVVVAALNNIYPVLRSRMGLVVFGFGLFHGFGFASVLSHLITNRSNLVIDLLGFNLGVEIGQVGIIVAAFPLLFALRHSVAYLRVIVPVGSLLIAALALGWFFERALELSFMPF